MAELTERIEREEFLSYIIGWGFKASAFLIRPYDDFLCVVEWEDDNGWANRLIWEESGVRLTSVRTLMYHEWRTFPGCDEVMEAWLYHMPLAHDF